MSQCEVKIIQHTRNRATKTDNLTFQLKYRRFFHSELMTHRVFSRNASSSRAIPVKTMLKQVWSDPAIPLYWGKNQAGMKARSELEGIAKATCHILWILAGRIMCVFAWLFMHLGLHKQIANRILEPWQFIHVVLTATDLDNFFKLRNHEDAQPEIRELAQAMLKALALSRPKEQILHVPYISETELKNYTLYQCLMASAARCARVSYLNHDGTSPDVYKDIKLAEMLLTSEHMSPFEHCGFQAGWRSVTRMHHLGWVSNLRDFIQLRKILERDANAEGIYQHQLKDFKEEMDVLKTVKNLNLKEKAE